MLAQYRFLNNTVPGVTQDSAEHGGTPVHIEGLTTYAPRKPIHISLTAEWDVYQRTEASLTASWAVLGRNDPEEEFEDWLLFGIPPDDPELEWLL